MENITTCLNREGFEVTGAFSGDEAVSLFSQKQFDLMLLDISMPGMNGYETMEHILGINPDMLIIIMTGFATVESAVRALKQGAWDYLKKPFEYTDLIKTVKNALLQNRLLNERKEFTARLEASERQYANMVNNSPDLIFTLDQSGRFTFINDQFEKVLGFRRDQVLGKSFESLVHPKDRGKIRGLVASGGFEPLELNFRFKKAGEIKPPHDGRNTLAYMALKASPTHLPAKGKRRERRGIYVVARDMTQRVNLEAQLRQAQKMEAIGTLAGGIAHDFNNILMGIQGYVSLVKSGFERDTLEFKRLANIDEYVASGAEMARQLLGFAQKNCSEVHLINLNYLLKMSAKMFGRTRKDVIIRPKLSKELWGTVVDEGQIKQVLMNLFVNAWQAMPQGGEIHIESANCHLDDKEAKRCGLERPGAYVQIGVRDTGIGIDEENITRIFDPFFTTKERGQGTGLGLATAYGIVKSHGGSIRAESELGKGTCFVFYLPAKNEVVRRGPVVLEKETIINGKGTILLVDDEKGVIDVCSEMLETLGYDVKMALGGKAAVEIMEQEGQDIDLVVLDMIMPEMNGNQTYDALRKIKPDLRVLISSGYARDEDIQNMLDKGCNDFILKPFDVSMLSEKINSLFEGKTRRTRSIIESL
ncbi:MAG: response regulator [Desulfobacterales bacterium]|nr:response regulator [Desulfobacterales bacterium]